jgi:hypothetical protein
MGMVLKSVAKPAPICGVLSIAAPFVGAGVACLAYLVYDPPSRYPNERFHAGVWLVLLIYSSIISGMILAAIAAVRGEKCRALPWIGFLLSAGPFLYAVVASSL